MVGVKVSWASAQSRCHPVTHIMLSVAAVSAQCSLVARRRLSIPRASEAAKAMPRCQSFNDLTTSEPTVGPQEPLFEPQQDVADGSSQAQPQELIGSISASAAELLQAAAAASRRTSRWAVALLPARSTDVDGACEVHASR